MIDIQLSDNPVCDCCGRDKLTKTFMINTYQGTTFLGYKCCARWFKLNMSGNKFQALSRLRYKIRNVFTAAELDNIFSSIETSERTWKAKADDLYSWER